MRLGVGFVSTHWTELLHGYGFVVDKTLVHRPKPSFPQPVPALRCWSVVKVACDVHQFVVQEAQVTFMMEEHKVV